MPLDPPSVEGPLGLRQIYPPVALKYPLVQKLIETPDFGVSEFNKTEKNSWLSEEVMVNDLLKLSGKNMCFI